MSMAVPMYGFGEGGGAALNFKVVPGLTQPGTAAEKTIWVKTEKIGAWYFSATQPEGMQEWDVWISTGTSSSAEFNALKKNGIQVYPIFAKQFVSGEWVDLAAKSYQNGGWVDWWNGELFDNGNQYEAFTGGWEAKSGVYQASTTKATATVGNTLYASGTGPNNCATLTTVNKIDLSGYSAIKINVVNHKALSGSAGTLWFHTEETGNLLQMSVGGADLTTGEITGDIPTGVTECYISIGVNNARMVEVDKIWLVR